jgi:hypothetical protein
MKTISRIAQSIALMLAFPFLWAFGLLTFSLVAIGQTWAAVVKVWR